MAGTVGRALVVGPVTDGHPAANSSVLLSVSRMSFRHDGPQPAGSFSASLVVVQRVALA